MSSFSSEKSNESLEEKFEKLKTNEAENIKESEKQVENIENENESENSKESENKTENSENESENRKESENESEKPKESENKSENIENEKDLESDSEEKNIENEKNIKSPSFFTKSSSSIFDRPVEHKEKEESIFTTKKIENNIKNKEIETKESDNSILFNKNCDLFVVGDSELEERGTGKIYIKKQGKYKLTMARENTGILGCNHFILESLHEHPRKNCFIFSTNFDNTFKNNKATIIIRFGEEDQAKEFFKIYNFAREYNLKILQTEKESKK